jgi:CRP-like cAMP-binding protein
MGVLDGAPRSADATAQRRTTLWQINRLAILEALKAEPNAALALLSLLAQRLRAADALMHRTATLDLGGRLARLLLDESTSGRITFSQGEMARLIGASRERVNRKLAEWRHKDWIDTGTAGLTVRNRNALRALCENGAAL